jgi:hypothetical protein
MSSATSVRQALEAYLAGREQAETVIAAVAAAYYRDGKPGTRERLRPVLDVIERAAPGSVELLRSDVRAGFHIKPGARHFPPSHEPELRAAVEEVLRNSGPRADTAARPGFLTRLARAIRGLFR